MNATRVLARLAAAAAAFVSVSALAATAPQAATSPASGVDLASIDQKVQPCDDFYRYVCSGWKAAHPIPPDQSSWGRFDELQDRNYEVLHGILEKDAPPNPKRNAIQRQVGDFYAACMDEKTIEAKGTAPLKADLARIDALSDRAALPTLLTHLHPVGTSALFSFSSLQDFKDATQVLAIADQSGLGLPDRDYYLKDDAKSAEQRKLYVEHVKNMLALLGEPAERAAADAAAVMAFETGLAKAQLDLVSRRNPQKVYHRLTVKDLQALTPGFAWDAYLKGLSAPPVTALNVTEPDYFRAMDALVQKTDLPTLRAYLRWHLVHASANALPKAFVDESFAFYGKTLAGAKELRPRWKRCVVATDGALGEALGREYVEETFPPAAKARTRAMVAAIEAALKKDIETLPWMTPVTKKAAEGKLRAIANKIGYPDRWRDYSSVKVDRRDYLGNAFRADVFEFRRQLGKIGKPVDRGEWTITPPTVNAYYNPLMNDINFPAGILQPPFYSQTADDAVNFGAIGAVIGHELTHGFDDSGRQFDAHGNLQNWWTPEDGKEFETRASCVADQYSGYTAVGDLKVNGRLTLGENVADNGGARLAYRALEESYKGKEPRIVDGLTPEQRFFVGSAVLNCENRSPEIERLLALTNPHSPHRYRIDGVVSNMPEFARAWGCKAGDPMVRQNACRVW
ncbi:MAG TPA: M13 family metallopeptidase [Solirubrobacterales bacterium]|nr:M13 family metallopeptidase [Solirubrobacterales bacterium]